MKRRSQLQRRQILLAKFRDIIRTIREDVKRAGLDKMTMAEINAEVDTTRREMRTKSRRPVKRSLRK